MANELLTPSMIWANYVAPKSFGTEILSEEQRDNISISRFFIELKEENIKLYCVMANGRKKTGNAILSVQQYKTELKEDLIINLAKKGYTAMLVDICGNYQGKGDKHTVYPEELSFANYDEEQVDITLVKGEIEQTCWYVWAKALKNAISFLKSKEEIEKVGVIGIGKVATSLWQAVSINNQVNCAVFVSNLGWRGYKGINKFSLEAEPVFEDEKLSYLASIGPESYAHHVKCPVLMLSPTNSGIFDLDRGYDTLSRISGRAYTAINYSAGYRNSVDYVSYKDALIFFDKALNSEDKKVDLPKEIDISCEIEDKKIVIEVIPQESNLKEVCIYASEESLEPKLRTWRKITNVSKLVKNKYYFEYTPYTESERAFFYAKCTYTDQFSICSNVICKTFNIEDIEQTQKFNIIYSSRLQDLDSSFSQREESDLGIELNSEGEVNVKCGPMEMYGICSKNGLNTFKICAKKYMPKDDSILMLDVYAKEGSEFCVKIISDYFGERESFNYSTKLLAGEFWNNIKLSISDFKREDGMPLKSFGNIQAIEFISQNECIINNVLWV